MDSAKIHSKAESPKLCLRGDIVNFQQPRVMGVLNFNSDSFYTGSRMQALDQLLDSAGKMVDEGADFLDIGVSSTRPGALISNPIQEWKTLEPALRLLLESFPESWISVDTYHVLVARQAINAGADIINDVSGGNIDPGMLSWIAENQIPYILMHMRGRPADMQERTEYTNLTADVIFELAEKVSLLRRNGHCNLMVDPGFGFSKTIEQNYRLLSELSAFGIFQTPVIAGVSRKSMIWKTLGITPEEALNGTTAVHTLLLQKGVDILRVHDVKAAREVIRIHTFAQQAGL